MPSYKIYRRHNCERQHRSYETFAKCAFRRAVWITGSGQYALVARCRALTVTLWEDPQDAEMRKEFIDKTACGGMCTRDHEIIQLEL